MQAGIVHEHINPAPGLPYLRGDVAHRLVIGDIAAQGKGPIAMLVAS